MPHRSIDLPHATERLSGWRHAWARTGRLVLLLDFDGTLAPIVDEPDDAAMPTATRAALDSLRRLPGVTMAIVSGRAMADARRRAALEGVAYAGNHGMEIDGPGIRRMHAEAVAARRPLAEVAERLRAELAAVDGVLVEDKELTLSVHYRRVAPARVEAVRAAVASAAAGVEGLRITEGKMVIEVRPSVDWHKGRAVDFLLTEFATPPGTPVIYLGDDTTDEDAFRALARRGDGAEGVIVADPLPAVTEASSYLRDTVEVGALLTTLAAMAPR